MGIECCPPDCQGQGEIASGVLDQKGADVQQWGTSLSLLWWLQLGKLFWIFQCESAALIISCCTWAEPSIEIWTNITELIFKFRYQTNCLQQK